MKQLFIRFGLAVTLLTVFSFRGFGADTYTFEYNLEKGRTYKQRSIISMNMSMEMMGQEIKMTSNMENFLNYDVTAVNNGVFDINLVYKKVKVAMSSPMGSFSMDSDAPDNNTANVVKAFSETPIMIQIDRKGKVLSVKNANELNNKLNSAANDQIKQLLGQQFTEKQIQTMWEQSSAIFPEKPVEIGESWTVSANVRSGEIDMINKMKVTLKQVNNNVATLDYTGTISTPEGGVVVKMGDVEAKVTALGDQTGTIRIDLKTGWVVSSESTGKSVQSIEVNGQKIPQKIDIKSTITAE